MHEESKERYREKYRLLGLRIAYYRKIRGLTQEQLAEAMGISWSFLSQIEANNGTTLKGISLNTLFLLSDTLKIPLVKLFEEE
ncbi:helix-turn-helix domain-containing protein [Acidaminobacterium chupaoyuni]